MKETYFGYDEDDTSIGSENSPDLSSISQSTLSDEELCDEVGDGCCVKLPAHINCDCCVIFPPYRNYGCGV